MKDEKIPLFPPQAEGGDGGKWQLCLKQQKEENMNLKNLEKVCKIDSVIYGGVEIMLNWIDRDASELVPEWGELNVEKIDVDNGKLFVVLGEGTEKKDVEITPIMLLELVPDNANVSIALLDNWQCWRTVVEGTTKGIQGLQSLMCYGLAGVVANEKDYGDGELELRLICPEKSQEE